MRCKRCHAIVAEGRKACPNCGTLIRKKRGNITLSSQSGVRVNRFADGISDTIYKLSLNIKRDSRMLILLIAAPLVLIGAIFLISCGASSCSCSCSSEKDNAEKTEFETRYNSYKPSNQFALEEMLYYISDGNIMSRSEAESYKHIYDSISASDLQSDGNYLYFREYNTVKRIKLSSDSVSESDAVETVLDYSSDENYTLGYFIAEGNLYYTLKENESELTTLYSDMTLLCGKYSDFGYLNGRIYYTVSDSDISRTLYSMNTDGSDVRQIIGGVSDYQLGGGYIYVIAEKGENNILTRLDTDGAVLMEWDIGVLTGGNISSIAANDEWVCFVGDSEDGSIVYRIEHDSADIASIFAYSSRIELTGVSSEWYAFESIEVTDGVETGRTYYIRNSRNGKSAM